MRVIVYLMKNHPQEVSDRFAQCRVGDVIVSSITGAELEFGVYGMQQPLRERQNLSSRCSERFALLGITPFQTRVSGML